MYLPNLTDRARLAINCLTNFCDRSRGNIPYFYTRLSDSPIRTSLAIWSYGDGLGRSVDALALLRNMLGEEVNQGIDGVMSGTLINLLGVDGLSWCPAEPWTLDVYHTRPAWLQQGTLLGLTSLYQLTGEDKFRRLAEKNIQAVFDMTTFHPEGFGDYPGDYYTNSEGWVKVDHDPMHTPSVFATSITMPLMRYYKLTNFEPALTLASALISWALRDHDNGQKLFDLGHFHCQSRLVTAVITRGVCTGNRGDFELGERLYLKAKSLGTLAGWFPEQINNPDQDRSEVAETCCLTDMLESAILLAMHYDAKYWHDVERFVKNYLLVHQIIDTDWFSELKLKVPDNHASGFINGRGDGVQNASLEKAIVGGFAGWGGVTAMSHDTINSNCNQHCCNAAGARAIYDAWRYAVIDSGDIFSVNLFIHRNHAVADIIVEEGRVGRLRITGKQARFLKVRIPEFVAAEEMSVLRNSQEIKCKHCNGFLEIGDLSRGDIIEISFPQHPRTTNEKIYPGEFTYHWQGSTVVSAAPFRGVRPLFVNGRFLKNPPVLGDSIKNEVESI